MARSRPIRLPGSARPLLTTWPRRVAACAAAALPAVAMCTVALSAAPAVQMSVPLAIPLHSRVRSLVVTVSNTTPAPVRPLFYLAGGRHSHRLRPAGNGNEPLVLAPDSQRTLRLMTHSPNPARPTWVIETVTPSPPTITWVPVPVQSTTHRVRARDVQPASGSSFDPCRAAGPLLASSAGQRWGCVG